MHQWGIYGEENNNDLHVHWNGNWRICPNFFWSRYIFIRFDSRNSTRRIDWYLGWKSIDRINHIMRRYLFQIISFFLLNSFIFHRSLQAGEKNLTQNELRKKYPIQFSIFATGRSPKQNGFVDLHGGYNVLENLTLGISIYNLYPDSISVQNYNRSVFENYEKKNTQPITYLFGHYFIFGGGLYLSGVIGRYPGIIEKHTEIASFQNNSPSILSMDTFSYSRPLLSYTVTYDPRYNIGIGLGYKWIFQNGLFFGADYGLTTTTPSRKTIYIEKDIRDFNRTISLFEYLLLKKQLEWETHAESYDNGLKLTYFINIHFGISF